MTRIRISDLTDDQIADSLARKWLRGEAVAIPKHLVELVRAAIGQLEKKTKEVA